MRTVITTITGVLFLWGCGGSCPKDADIAAEAVQIQAQRLEKEIFEATNSGDVLKVLKENAGVSRLFLHSDQYPTLNVLADNVYDLIKNPSIDTLYQESEAAFPDMAEVTNDLEGAFGKLKTLYPETKTPVLKTMVTGLYNDLFISDSLIVIGIDEFIGKKATYRPKDVPGYILSRYNPEHLSSIIVKFLAGQHVTNGKTATLLSEMVDFGKTYYLASRLLPCTPDSILLGYTPQDMQLIHENEPVIWANLVENEVLYETSHIIIRKFLGERPNVYEINQKCPGRIGAWVGWQIVEAYMRKNDTSITALLNESDNDKIFRLSGYKPQSH